MTETFRHETRVEDQICLILLLSAFLSLFMLTVDLSRANPPFVSSPPPCEINCR